MARKRVVKTYKDTSARGEREAITGDRYFVRVELVSVKVLEDQDKIGRTSEIYFRIDRHRTPRRGEINLERNQIFTPPDGLTLYAEFLHKKGGGAKNLTLKVYDQDALLDDVIFKEKFTIKLGQSTEYLAFNKEGVKVKIGVSALETRY